MQTSEILIENTRRMAERAAREAYDPVRGTVLNFPDLEPIPRARVVTPDPDCPNALVPESMLADPAYLTVRADFRAWRRLRCRHDFEYWCATCVTIHHKTEGRDVKFRLNYPQRRVVCVLEAQRRRNQPLRMIMLKARQWGGSTLVQTYMAWIQCCHRQGWNSLICAHVKDTAAAIRGMYSRILENYPEEMWDGDEPPRFRPFERAANIREIAGRDCRVTIASAESQDAVRGSDFAMAHLSETAFWPSTLTRSPLDFIRAVCGAVALEPLTLVVMESTANGVGNFFHREWLRAKEGNSDKYPFFVPWYMIEIYRLEPPDPAELVQTFTDYELKLWRDLGCTLDQIWWYRMKCREYQSHDLMMAEYPTDDTEAFMHCGSSVFNIEKIENLRKECAPPALVGELGADGEFVADAVRGGLKVWEQPVPGARYIVTVDVGGRTPKSDWSVIAVLDISDRSRPVVVAQWRGHCDHDLLAERARRIALHYNRALLVVESNTMETECDGYGAYILNRLAENYPNLYCRHTYDRLSNQETTRLGFHTNRATKAMMVSDLIEAVRDGAYVERDNDACDELATYEQLPSGTYAARRGRHDDILITRALAIHLARTLAMPAAVAPVDVRLRW